jgi:AcrR family transcriptional regulator
MTAEWETGDGELRPVWERPEPPSRPTPSPLSRPQIVRAAIELADAAGLESVSVRKVAAALDAGPMRLYSYLSTKDELLDLMIDAVYGELVPTGPAGDDWRATLSCLAHRTRRAAQRHEWFVDLLGGRPRVGPNALAFIEVSLAALDGVPGFDDIDFVMQAVRAVHSYVIGAVRSEITELRAERATGMDEQQWQQSSGLYMQRMLASGRYPTLVKVFQQATHADPATTFNAGLDQMLDGIAAQVAR